MLVPQLGEPCRLPSRTVDVMDALKYVGSRVHVGFQSDNCDLDFRTTGILKVCDRGLCIGDKYDHNRWVFPVSAIKRIIDVGAVGYFTLG